MTVVTLLNAVDSQSHDNILYISNYVIPILYKSNFLSFVMKCVEILKRCIYKPKIKIYTYWNILYQFLIYLVHLGKLPSLPCPTQNILNGEHCGCFPLNIIYYMSAVPRVLYVFALVSY